MADEFEDRWFRTGDGLRLHYRDYRAKDREAGAPVLCLHGLTRNVRDFEDLAPQIAALGRRVIVASQRGRGASDADPRPERYTPAVYVADMLGLLDELEVPRAVFVGTSMGGLMTLIAAQAAPSRLAGAVLNDIGPEIDPAGLARIRGYVGGAGEVATWAEAGEICRRINGPAFPDETAGSFWTDFARKLFREHAPGVLRLDYDPAIAASVAGEGGGAGPDLWPLFDALAAVPTLVVRGERSDILMPSTLKEMRRRKPDLQTAIVPRVGHAPFLTEPGPLAALRRFLAET